MRSLLYPVKLCIQPVRTRTFAVWRVVLTGSLKHQCERARCTKLECIPTMRAVRRADEVRSHIA